MDLQAFAGDALAHFAGEQLDHRRFGVGAHAVVDLLAHGVEQGARGLDLRGHVGDLEADGLEVADRVAELGAVARVLHRVFQRALCQAERACSGMGTRGFQAGGGQIEGLAFLADHLRMRHAAAVEGQFPGGPAVVADLGDDAALDAFRQLAARLLDHEGGQALVARLGVDHRVGAADHQDEVGLVGESAPVLAAGNDPVVAVAHGAARDIGHIGAGIGLGQRERAQELATRHARQVLGLLLGRQRLQRADQAVAAGDQAAHAHPAARQLLGHQAVLVGAQPQAAVFLGNQDAEVAELGHFVDQLARDLAFFRIQLVGDGQHALHRELARGLLDHAPLFGQFLHLALLAVVCGPALLAAVMYVHNSQTWWGVGKPYSTHPPEAGGD
ncbi:hypothetical protein FQZ97_367450 [compost metagenome]